MAPSQKQPDKRRRFSKSTVFAGVIIFMAMAFIVLVSIAMCGDGSDTQKKVCDLCGDFLKGGFGALLMLLGTSGK